MTEQINNLCERVKLFSHSSEEKTDGEIYKNYYFKGEVWASIIPLNPRKIRYFYGDEKSLLKPFQEEYKIIMRKFHTRHTLHAYITRLVWNHKTLDIVSDWQINPQSKLLETIAVNTQEVYNG